MDPPPDLVIEIELTRSSLDKLSLYAPMGVPEVWRCTGVRLAVLLLHERAYEEQEESAALPGVDMASLLALVKEAPSLRRPAWARKVRDWARGDVP